MKLDKLFEEAQELFEANKYKEMITDDFIRLVTIINKGNLVKAEREINEEINNARKDFKRIDIVTWYIRIYMLGECGFFLSDKLKYDEEIRNEGIQIVGRIIERYNKKTKGSRVTVNDVRTGDFIFLHRINENLKHFLSLPISNIQNYRFGWELPDELFEKFEDYEREWKELRKRLIPDDPDLKVMIDMGEYVWFDLESASCSAEGEAMGHCGNSPSSSDPNQTILSLRQKQRVGNEIWWKPVATFILHKRQGMLGEMKGYGNEKPAEKYHPYIIKLLEHSRIKGIVGGGYLPDSNFSINDLSDSERERLVNMKPALQEFLDYVKEKGVDDHIKQILIDEGLEVDEETGYIIVDRYKDVEQLIDHTDKSDGLASRIYQIMSGEESIDLWDDRLTYDYLGYHITGNQETVFKEYVESKYPDEYEEIGNWFEVIKDEDDDLYTQLDQAYGDARRSGMEGQMFGALKDAYLDFGHDEDSNWYLSPSEFTYDTEIKVMTDWESIERSIKNDYFGDTPEEVVSFVEDMMGGESPSLTATEPYNGFDDFDDSYFENEIETIVEWARDETTES